MLRVEDADPENLLRSSFHQYQQERNAPELERRAEEIQKEAMAVTVPSEEAVAEYYTWLKLLQKTQADMQSVVMQPNNCLPFLNSGRVVRISSHGVDWGYGVIINHRKCKEVPSIERSIGFDRTQNQIESVYVLDVLIKARQADGSKQDGQPDCTELRPHSDEGKNGIEIVQCSLRAVKTLSAIRMGLPKDLTREGPKKGIQKSLDEIMRRFAGQGGVPELDPVKDVGITDSQFNLLSDRAADLQKEISESAFNSSADKEDQLAQYSKRVSLLEEARVIRQQAKETQTVTMREELRRRKRILKRLGYVSAEGVLGVKGRFACELTTADELVLADMVFDGVFNTLSVEQTVALLSAFVHKEQQKEKDGGVNKLRADMQAPFRALQSAARRVAKVSAEAHMKIEEEEYVNSFNPALVEVSYAWAAGSKFSEICKLTDIFEGSIIRALRRLEELLRQLASGALAIGNVEMKKLFEDGSDKIRRGIVFAASLYL